MSAPIPSSGTTPPTFVPATTAFGRFLQRYALLGKIAGIVILGLLQLVPLVMLDGLLNDRLQRRSQADEDITAAWGGNQQVLGPVLIVPYAYYYTEKKPVEIKGQTVMQDTEVSVEDIAYFLPSQLKIEGHATPEKLHKGIYQSVVYNADLELSGEFAPPDFASFKLGKYEVHWDRASVAVPILDLRGAQETLKMQWGDSDLLMQPGSTLKFYTQGIHADIPNLKSPTGPLLFHLKLSIRGSGDLQFAPLGMENVVHLSSTWPDPGFDGAFLPAERTVTPQGFDATWRISYYGRNFPQQWRNADITFPVDELSKSYYGVSFLTLIDSYRNVERAIKYGVLFIALISVTFFLFEILARLRLHLIQYAMVSAALILFYLTLLSLSEVVSFGLSYVIAAGVSILLIAGYCSHILANRRLVLGLTAGLATIYGALYVILQLEDYSLLVGTAVLVAALAAVMYTTRKVNWYGPTEG